MSPGPAHLGKARSGRRAGGGASLTRPRAFVAVRRHFAVDHHGHALYALDAHACSLLDLLVTDGLPELATVAHEALRRQWLAHIGEAAGAGVEGPSHQTQPQH